MNYKQYLEDILQQYEYAIVDDIKNPSLKHADRIKHYVDIVRGLKYIIRAWQIIESKNINSNIIRDALTINILNIRKEDGMYYHLDALDAQNIKLEVFDAANIAILLN